MNEKQNNSNVSFIIVMFILVFFGLVMLSSASSVVGYAKYRDSYYFLKHQVLHGLLPGLILFFIFSKLNYKLLKKWSNLILLLSIVLLVLVFVPGVGAVNNNARSWIQIGDFSIQPSELAKLALLIYLSSWMHKNKDKINSLTRSLIPFIIILAIIAGLIAMQPDVGTMFIIVIMAFGIYFASGAKLSYIFSLCAVGILTLLALIKIAPYRLHRLTVFLNPKIDPQGIGYHINQALLAIGSGGLFGLGLGHSRQKFQYLPEVLGDSIFAVMGEELGFVITIVFVLLYIFFIFKILKSARTTKDDFAKIFLIGFAVWIGCQAFLNMGAMVGITPLTGVPLPFVSYGGTALMTALAGCGIVVDINKK